MPNLIRQLSSFMRVPERVTLLFAGRADGTAAPVTTDNPLPVALAAGATVSDPLGARNVTLLQVLAALGGTLAVQDARPPVTDALYATTGTGAPAALPAGATAVELTAVSASLWFRFGSVGLGAVSAPAGGVGSGSPRYLPQGASIIVDVRTAARYAVSGGSYVMGWWL